MLNTRIEHQEDVIKRIKDEELAEEEKKEVNYEKKFAAQQDMETQTTFFIEGCAAQNQENYLPNYENKQVKNILGISGYQIAV